MWRLLVTGLALLAAAAAAPVVTVGLQSILGPQYQDTFGPYLTNSTAYTFQTRTYTNDTAMLADATSGLLNMTFAGPVQYLCLALAGATSDGVAELVSSSYVDGSPVERLAGAIVTRAGSPVRTIQDLRGRVVLTGPVSSLTTFAAQWQLVQANNLSLFSDTAGVFLQQNITQVLPDLLAGVGDVAFVPSSYLERFYPNSSLFAVVNAQPAQGFPYQHSTPLFPNAVLSALDTTAFEVRRATAQALFAVRPDAPVAAAGMYYGFTPLGAYTQVRTLMASEGLLNNMTQCRSIADLADLVLCPPGFVRAPAGVDRCRAEGLLCPPNYQCVCSPCQRIVRQPRLLGLSIAGFGLVLTAVILAGSLAAFVVLRVCWLRSQPDPYHELGLHAATVLGESSNGPVFGTEWRGQQVAVKRLFRAPGGVRTVFDRPPRSRCPFLQVAGRTLGECFYLSGVASRRLHRVRTRMGLHHGSVMPVLGLSRGAFRCEVLAIMPRMQKGTVSDLLASRNILLDVTTVVAMLLDVVHAVLFLHACRPPLVGVNFKPHHLFLDERNRVLIGVSFRTPNMHSVWAPPECLRGESGWTAAADVYAFSMLMYTLAHRRTPFEGRRSQELLTAIQSADESTLFDARPPLQEESPLNPLIEACWAQQPADRPTFEQIRLELTATGRRTGTPLGADAGPPGGPSSTLLRGMFPEHVRRLLEEGRPAGTDEYPCVTVFFCDIVGFTSISTVLPPPVLKDMLNELWSFMDRTANELGVHKLETAGDALLAVTNVMQKQEDHAARMARFALRVLAGVTRIPVNPLVRDGPSLQLRVGLHSGPVVGGVAGINNLRYCLFGLTMSVASRMESTGEPGRIQVTERAAALIAQDPLLAGRILPRPGLTDVKGQGPTKTCWLLTDAQIGVRRSVDCGRPPAEDPGA